LKKQGEPRFEGEKKTPPMKKKKNSISIQPRQNMWKCISKQYGISENTEKMLK
jgi:hypothetical protein